MEIKNKINKTELAQIYEISKEQFNEESWNLSQFESSYNLPSSIFLVIKESEKVVSFILAMDLIDSINLLLIATKENYKRRGFSKQLINCLKQYNKKIWLEVKEGNSPARKLYEGLGFKEIYTRKKYYSNGENAIIYELENY